MSAWEKYLAVLLIVVGVGAGCFFLRRPPGGQTMTKLFLASVAALSVLSASTAYADQRFLRAAVFFLSGGDNDLEYKVVTDGTEAIGSESMGIVAFQDKKDPCKVYFISFH